MTSMVNFSLLLCWSAVNITAIGYFMLKQRSGNYLRDLACPVWLTHRLPGHPQDIIQRIAVAIQVEHRGQRQRGLGGNRHHAHTTSRPNSV